MPPEARPPRLATGAAWACPTKVGQDDSTADSISSTERLQLADSIAFDRLAELERINALQAAYAALRRADHLRRSNDLLDAALACCDELAAGRARLASLDLLARCAGLDLDP